MKKRYLAMLLAVTTIFAQLAESSFTVTAAETETSQEYTSTEVMEDSDVTTAEGIKDTSTSEEVQNTETEALEVEEILTGETETSEVQEVSNIETESYESESECGTETSVSEDVVTEESEISDMEQATEEVSETSESENTDISGAEDAFIEEVSEIEEILTEEIISTESEIQKIENVEKDGIHTLSTDDWYVSISSNVDVREDNHTWLFVDESQTFTANVENAEDGEYTLTWEIGTIDNDDGIIYESDAIAYTTAEGAVSTSITGKAAATDLAIHVIVTETANGTEVTDNYLHFDVRDEVYDYQLPVGDDISQLPYWDLGIDKYFNYYVENPEYPYGSDLTCEITSLTVTNGSDDEGEGDAVTLSEWDDGNGWNLHMERFGHAVGTLTYNAYGGQEVEKNFNIWIGTDVYNLGIESATGVEQILPGESVDLSSYFGRECYDEENGHYQGSTEGVIYEWSIEDNNITEDVLTIEQDGSEPSILHVTVADNLNNLGMWIPIALRAYMPGENGQEEVAYQCFHINICDNYYCLDPVYLETSELGVGEEITIDPTLYKHTYGEGVSDKTDAAHFRFEWDTNAIQITDGNGKVLNNDNPYGTAPFKFKKLQNWHTNVNFVAECLGGDGSYCEVTRRSWDFFEVNYDVWFDNLHGDGYTWLYKNDTSGENYDLVLNNTNLDEKDCELVWEVGFCDEEGNFYYTVPASDTTYDYNETNSTLTLHAKGLWDKLKTQIDNEPEDIWLNIRVIVTAGSIEVEREDIGIQLRKEVYDYDLPVGDDLSMLPHWTHSIDKNLNYHVENAEYPYGTDFSTTITSVTVENAFDDEGEGDVATITEWDDGNGWDIHVERYGHAIGTLTYITHDGQTAEKTFNIWVGSDVYELYISSGSGVEQILPGEGMDLSASLIHECYSEENGHYQGSIEGVTYEWILEDENCNQFMSMEVDSNNPTILHVNISDNTDAMGWIIPISLRAYMHGENGKEEVAYSNYNINVCYDYYRLDPIYPDTQELAVGETVTVAPELYYHCYQQETEAITENVQYRVEWDTNAIEVTDSTGTVLSDGNAVGTAPFTIRKLQNWHTNLNLLAERLDEEGNYNEVTRRSWDFYELDYGVWFKDLRGDGNTWIFTNDGDGEAYELSLDTQNLDGKTYDVQWEIGICDENGTFTYSVTASDTTYSMNADKTSVTLYANGLWNDMLTAYGYTEENMPNDIWFEVRAVVTAGGIELAQAQTSVNIHAEVCDYQIQAEDIRCLPGWKYLFPKNQIVYVENPEYPQGAELETQIISIVVANAEDEEGEGDVVTLIEWDDSTGWDMCFNRVGHAVATITYNTLDGQTAANTFDIYIETDMYIMYMWSATGTNCVLPGGSIDLVADINHWCYNEEIGENYVENADDIEFEWRLGDSNCSDIVSLNPDSEDSKILHIEVSAENSVNRLIPIELRAYIQDGEVQTEVAYQSFDIWVAEAYYQLFTGDVIAEPGERIELPAELKLISLDNPEGIIQQDVTYSLEAYTDLLQLDETGTGLEILTDVIAAEDTPASVLVKVMADMTNEYGDQIHEEAEAYVIVCVHDYKQTASTPSTCTKQGTITYTCEKCDNEKIEKQPLAAHTPVTDAAVAATCTKTGLTEGSHCSVCNKTLVAQQTTKALGHAHKETLTKAEIGKDGKIVNACTRCGTVASTTVISAISSVELSNTSYTYNGKECKPTVTVKDKKGNVLSANNAYTVSYSSGCKNPGKYTVTVTFTGNYAGTKTLTYTINPKSVAISDLTAEKKGFTAKWKKGTSVTGYEIQYSTSSKFTSKTTKTKKITKSGTTSQKISSLKETTKYYVRIRTYKTITESGKETKLYSAWSDTITVITKDKKGKISAVKSVKLSETEYTYNGKTRKPTVTVKDKAGNTLEQDTDYTVSYSSGCKKPGKYTVTVKFKGNYSSTKKKTLTYTILPKSTPISKVSATSKGFKVTWKKGSEITGYEIQYSTSSKFSKKTTKTVTVSKSSTTSKAITKLSAKKKYYVRIRTYKTVKVNGKSTKLYSDWSKSKTVTTKK